MCEATLVNMDREMQPGSVNARRIIAAATLAVCAALAPGVTPHADSTSPDPAVSTSSEHQSPNTPGANKAPSVAPQLTISPKNSGRGGQRGRQGEIEILIDPTEALEKSHQSAQELAPAKPGKPGKPDASSRRNPPISETPPKSKSE